jgi:hypothetical protein
MPPKAAVGSAWTLRKYIEGIDCSGIPQAALEKPYNESTDIELSCAYYKQIDLSPDVLATYVRRDRLYAAKWTLLPPLGLLLFGCIVAWIIRGFLI